MAKYSDKEWICEKIRRIVIRDIHRGLEMKAQEDARIEKDNEIVE